MKQLASVPKKQKRVQLKEGRIGRRRRYSAEELLACGLINLDKPKGRQSKHIVADLKEFLQVDKLGHAGTLDGNTTGVLPLMIGKATKLSGILSKSDKIYRGKFKLHGDVSKKKLRRGMAKFVGVIQQLPPKISAVKRRVRKRKIYWFDLLKLKKNVASFEVACQHGTYVRKLCHTLGAKVGPGAHMFELERIQSGPFKIRKSIGIDVIRKRYKKYRVRKSNRHIRKFMTGPEAGVRHIPKAWLDSEAVKTVVQGSPVFVPGVLRVTEDFSPGRVVAIFGQDNRLKALGEAKMSVSEIKKQRRGVAIKTDLVLV